MVIVAINSKSLCLKNIGKLLDRLSILDSNKTINKRFSVVLVDLPNWGYYACLIKSNLKKKKKKKTKKKPQVTGITQEAL